MYCTGGIRCDVYSALLRQKGYKKLYTLHGGIQHYLREEGNEHWKGSLFVFDGRMAINPALEGQLEEGGTRLDMSVVTACCDNQLNTLVVSTSLKQIPSRGEHLSMTTMCIIPLCP